MNTQTTTLTLHEFAERIRDDHAAVLACDEHMAEQKRMKIQKAITCGEHLIEAKKMMDHGQWRSWLADNCKGICFKTATNYMRLANAHGEHVAVTQGNRHQTPLVGHLGELTTQSIPPPVHKSLARLPDAPERCLNCRKGQYT